jgi:vacuolar-type H+-ATPase subunit E/Vma4
VTLDVAQAAALADARAQARAIRRSAAERADALIAAAHAEASALVRQRRAVAERLAEHERRERLAEARAEARTIVLRAQRTVFEAARTAAHAAAHELASDPGYRRLLAGLSAEARERLAAVGPVEVRSASGGGVIARAGSCQIDYSLAAQVERCLEAMSGELERLWR